MKTHPKGGGWAQIYEVIRLIPPGQVATYGQVARLAGRPGHARQVGYALHAAAEDEDLPWHRVINARGEVSERADPSDAHLQRHLLIEEGILPDRRGRVSLRRYGWKPR